MAKSRLDVIVPERSGYSVFSEGTPRKRLGGPYKTRGEAEKRLGQIEWFKAHHDARPIKRVRAKLPRQIPPTQHAKDYARALLRLVARIRAAYEPVMRALPDVLESAARARTDVDESDKLRRLLAQAAAEAGLAVNTESVDGMARQFANRVGAYNKLQLARQVRAALGVDPVFKDKTMAAKVDHFAHENVALVQTIPADLHGELSTMVTRAVSGGTLTGGRGGGAGSLRKQIEDRFDVSKNVAKRIARDQVGKFYAAVNHSRQRELGVTRFVWRTVGDERVTGAPGGPYANSEPSHYDLDGEEYDYDDPPNAGRDGEPALPGEAIQCRCYAEPVLDEGDDDQDDDADEQDSDQEDDDD